jgi:digeranylgeranylglycerophospholipid reductase
MKRQTSDVQAIGARDVVVIGGGPAGSMTARLLAKRGYDVLLLEEHEVIGTPTHCTGLMGAEAFDEFDLPRNTILGEAGSARFWGAAGQSVAIHSDQMRAVVIDRAQFDLQLATSASHAGVELRRGCRAETVTVHPDDVRIVTNRGESLVARACVLACGARYRFHRALGLGLPDMFLQSAQLETPFPTIPEIQVRLGREVAPDGFAWLVPVTREGRSHARIGLMSATRSRERFAAFLTRSCERAGVDRTDLPAPRLKMLPLGPVPRTFADRVIAVGDAAGLVKPTTGGGIHYGLLSGSLAAEVLDEALRRDRLKASFLGRYERLWRQRLGQEIRVGLAFRRIAARLSDDSIDEIIELARVNGVIPLLQEHAQFNWHRKAAVALLGHPSFRRIVFKSLGWRDSVI